jgi:hypothetical protein
MLREKLSIVLLVESAMVEYALAPWSHTDLGMHGWKFQASFVHGIAESIAL